MTDAKDDQRPNVLLMMGVSGSGKSTIGAMLAGRLGWEYAEADDFHSPAGIAQMESGKSLDDEDRWPWLHRIADWIDENAGPDTPVVVSCSALKKKYRDLLRRPDMMFVYLHIDRDLLHRRMVARQGHFFPTELLEHQFSDLEPPTPDERALLVRVEGTPGQVTNKIIEELHLNGTES